MAIRMLYDSGNKSNFGLRSLDFIVSILSTKWLKLLYTNSSMPLVLNNYNWRTKHTVVPFSQYRALYTFPLVAQLFLSELSLIITKRSLSDSGCFQPDVRSWKGGTRSCRVSCLVSRVACVVWLSCPDLLKECDILTILRAFLAEVLWTVCQTKYAHKDTESDSWRLQVCSLKIVLRRQQCKST